MENLNDSNGKQKLGILLLLFLAGVTALDAMAIDMYLPTFLELKKTLNINDGQVQQTMSIFLVGLAIGQGICGPILDRFGRKIPLLIGLLIFVIGSVLAAMSSTFFMLMFSRLLQALGASMGLTAPRAIIADELSENEAANAFSVLMQTMMIAPIVAPLLGAQLLAVAGWRSVFWALAIISGLFLIWGFRIIPNKKIVKSESTNLSSIFSNVKIIFSNKAFMTLALSASLLVAAFFIYLGAVPYVFLEHFNSGPKVFSYIFVSNALGMIATGQINIYLLQRNYSSLKLISFGVILMTFFGVIHFLTSMMYPDSFWIYSIVLGCIIASTSFIFGNIAAFTMDQVKEQAGLASGILGMIQYGVGAILAFFVSLTKQSILTIPLVIIICGVFCYLLYIRGRKLTK